MDIARIRERVKRLVGGERGQATVEYAVVVMFTILFVGLGFVWTVQLALLDFFQDVASLIALPIP